MDFLFSFSIKENLTSRIVLYARDESNTAEMPWKDGFGIDLMGRQG
jgi:hypothetical protein